MISSDLALVLKVIALETWKNVKENLPQSLLTVNTLAPSLQVYLKVFLGRSFLEFIKLFGVALFRTTLDECFKTLEKNRKIFLVS